MGIKEVSHHSWQLVELAMHLFEISEFLLFINKM